MFKHQLISKILNRFFKHESVIEGEGRILCIYHSIEVRKVLDLSNTIQLNNYHTEMENGEHIFYSGPIPWSD